MFSPIFNLIISKHFNICCFIAVAYTTLDRLRAVFLYLIIGLSKSNSVGLTATYILLELEILLTCRKSDKICRSHSDSHFGVSCQVYEIQCIVHIRVVSCQL